MSRRPRAVRPFRKVGLIPEEILTQIFLLVLRDVSWCLQHLILVCRRWRAIILSIPGIHFYLRIRSATQKEQVEEFIQGRKSRLRVIVDMGNAIDGKDFNADNFHASFIAAAKEASRWSSLRLVSFLPPVECEALHLVQPLEHLDTFILAQGCDLGNFFKPLMTAVTTTATSHLTRMDLGDPGAALYLMQPACLHIFSFLTTLKVWLAKKMESPVDILPHLCKLQTFEACHLYLPIHPLGVHLPLIQTLQVLHLKSVSVQWVAGRVFPVLDKCSIIFPHHADTIQALWPVTMPSCSSLKYDSNDLGPLGHFIHPPLTTLEVKSGQWSMWRGNPQLALLQPTVAASGQKLISLDLHVQCSECLLIEILRLVPALKKLHLRLNSPHAVSEDFFLAFVVREPNVGDLCGMVGLPNQIITPLCMSLQELHLHYKRWLRGPEKKALISVFGDIVASHELHNLFFLFDLRFDEGSRGLCWTVQEPLGRCYMEWTEMIDDNVPDDEPIIFIGILSLHAIIPLSAYVKDDNIISLPFKEADYLHFGYALTNHHSLSLDLLFSLHQLVGLGGVQGWSSHCHMEPNAPLRDLPLFHTLRVLQMEQIHPSFLAGQTFHKLESCRVYQCTEDPILSHGPFTEMPICTKLDVWDLSLLASFKLPRICKLGVPLDHLHSNMIWEEHIAVNANLSGLKLLHVHSWHQNTDPIQIFRSLPVLESLIITDDGSTLGVDFFRAFIPMDVHGTSKLKESSGGDQISSILCPALENILIEDFDLADQPQLIPVLKRVVTLRAVCGSPLKRFSFVDIWCTPKTEYELIRRDGCFVGKVKAKCADTFKLDFCHQ